MENNKTYHVAFDCGNSSFRVLLGTFENDNLAVDVIEQVSNDPIRINGYLYWDILRIFDGLKKGLKKAYDKTGCIDTVGITTWGIDFGIFSKNDILLSNPLCYRNTFGVDSYNSHSEEQKDDNWKDTGIQNHPMNSLYQMEGIRKKMPEVWENADTVLFIPDMLNYLFTGSKYTERSIASTSQLFDVRENNYSKSVLERYDLSSSLFPEIMRHGDAVGMLKKEICKELNINNQIPFICTPSHDTASAVVAVPGSGNQFFLSSGTWSLIGVELDTPVINDDSYRAGFTNEAGVFNTITYLKNATGLYLLQQIKKDLAKKSCVLSWEELMRMAMDNKDKAVIYDTNCDVLFSTDNVVGAISEFTGSSAPEVILSSTYKSLAECYRINIEKIKEVTGKDMTVLHVIGGGSRDNYLNQLTANALGMKVIAGPIEAASIGNICIQKCYTDKGWNLDKIRSVVRESFVLKEFIPE